MMDTVELEVTYVVTAIDKNDGRVYYAIDNHSGGYPYWSTTYNSRKEMRTLEDATKAYKEAVSATGYMNKVTDVVVGVTRTTISLNEIDNTAITEERKRIALEKLTEDERRLLGL